MRSLRALFRSILFLTGFAVARAADATPLLVNGDFEAGLTGWFVYDQPGGSGTWLIDDADGLTPISGNSTVGPAGGSQYAVSDQTGPGAHALGQPFVVPGPASSVVLSFDMFVNDWSGVGPIIDPAGLDYTVGPNQHARVDILDPSLATSPLDTGAAVLATFYLGEDPFAPPNPYTPYSFDITAVVGAGGTFALRFAEVDNQFFFNMGVDNVSIESVPEPGTLALLGLGIMGCAASLGSGRRERA